MPVGRNDPCPCGSGRKYKRCHLRAEERERASTLREQPSTPEQIIASLGYRSVDRPPRALPTNESEFEAYMLAMDAEFVIRGMALPARTVAAMFEVFRDQGQDSGVVNLSHPATPEFGDYSENALISRIESWYVSRYGDRVRVDLSVGSTVVDLRGDVWEYRFPAASGPALYYARDALNGPSMYLERTGPQWLPVGHPFRDNPPWPRRDVLAGVRGLQSELVPHLTEAELKSVLELQFLDWQWLHWLTKARHHELIGSAGDDARAAVRQLVARPTEVGQARWSTQQMTEKTLKSYLKYSTASYPRSGREAHNLVALSRRLPASASLRFPEEIWTEIDCPPGIRYGEIAAGTALEAVRVFRIALGVCGAIAALLCQRFPLALSAPRTSVISERDEAVRELLSLMWERAEVPQGPR